MAWVTKGDEASSVMMDKFGAGRTLSGIEKTTSAMLAEKLLFGDTMLSDDTTLTPPSFLAPPAHPALGAKYPPPPTAPPPPPPPPPPLPHLSPLTSVVPRVQKGDQEREGLSTRPSPLPDAERRPTSSRPGARVTLRNSSRFNSAHKGTLSKSSAPTAGTEAEPADEWGLMKAVDEEGQNIYDIPQRLTVRPGTISKLKELEHQSIRLAEARNNGSSSDDMENLSRASGDIWVRQWILPIWRRRYASVVDHAHFGPVLFLFKYQDGGFICVKHSAMIALDSTQVKLGRNILDKDGLYKMEFTLKTERRKYVFAAPDHMKREYWIEHLRSEA
mmetsp:Transcript_515/g.972  ORF Transcript_515/g.972 Transcript_515/m.972 type:complete len:331 (-) Transcript_515:238-1230(-)|eukprot:CAMPEP_0184683214 /NCGR_PEP_ID=MMETSP0312-20130426/10324_1 /TAXON_ID=31354 /ORGANISM="Compsopogon coeruleus, Strain SAG 36.94" /LENGTH=330 /DNA_ID=CAMNT_0027135359 /DNA_START=195 /DNA_END=1187 /DNA_ORIENTATION=-